MVDWNDPVFPVSVQTQMLSLNRSSLYYEPLPSSEWNLQLDQLTDIIYTKHPELGYRRITAQLKSCYGFHIDKKVVLSRIQEMSIQTIYLRQDTSKLDPANKIYPYLLKDAQASCPDHVWSIDIAYIPTRKSQLCLTAIINWYSRYVLLWAMNDAPEIPFILEACKYALRDARPNITNSDQGSHFIDPEYINLLSEAGVPISIDHRGRAYDNIFTERFWRSLEYEDVHLKDYGYPGEARLGIHKYMDFYNNKRSHQSLGYKTPAGIYSDRE